MKLSPYLRVVWVIAILGLGLVSPVTSNNLAHASVFSLRSRGSIAVVRLRSRGKASRLRTSDLVDALDRALKISSPLSAQTEEQAGLDARQFHDCPVWRRVQCWIGLAGASEQPPQYLLLMATAPTAKGIELSAYLYRLDQALQRIAAAKTQGLDQDTLENQLYKHTIIHRVVLPALNSEALQKFMTDLFTRRARKLLTSYQDHEPMGQMLLSTSTPGLIVSIDNQRLGTTSDRKDLIENVPPGLHRIHLTDPTGAWPDFETQVQVQSGQTHRIDAAMARIRHAPIAPDGVFYGSLGVMAVGTGLLVYGLAAPTQQKLTQPCLSGTDCGGSTFKTFCDLTADNCSESGVMVAPLGYSLMTTGGLGALAARYFEDEPAWMWLSTAVAVVVGLGTYGVSAATTGR